MMVRRRRQHDPDKRLDWRDPDMPVLRPWEEPWGERVLKAIPPHEESEHCASMVSNRNPTAPTWRDDPTYNLARPGARNLANRRKHRMQTEMSPGNAVSKAPASKPAPTPLELAIAHQDAINAARDKIRADAACINRLLVGRTVRVRRELREFQVTECRLGLSGAVTIHGRLKDKTKGRLVLIGTVREIEVLP